MQIRPITAADDAAMQTIIQQALKAAKLDIPGTAYFDANLAHLSAFYAARPDRAYWVVVDSQGTVVGGAGCGEYGTGQHVAELQKLYLRPDARGHGLSYQLIDQVTAFARQTGYQQLYLESSHRLAAALHVYDRSGFTRLDQPLAVAVHSAMDRFYIKSLQ
ncbi:GNAT family N-acetyltransferase [Lactiplantibacillus modestisalitolerans]|uniref:GNAT family N-acetyltransferase n=1 Tax=Lactiplantibacillus modestisalitolerans TaxID=1457219 RepID=A0ABV5WRF9_9LACO|nr:GNAT family N-acetyltransferase [Lactiplantibacillus modestisalitolerans]